MGERGSPEIRIVAPRDRREVTTAHHADRPTQRSRSRGEKPTRRRFLGWALAIGGGGLAVANEDKLHILKSLKDIVFGGKKERKTPDFKESKIRKEVKNIIQNGSDVSLQYSMGNPQRAVLETQIFNHLPEDANDAEIRYALMAAGTSKARDKGMGMFWRKRQAGELADFYHVLKPEQISWAQENGIRPRMLAFALDALGPARELLEAGKDIFYKGLSEEERKRLRISDTIPNAGIIAKLAMKETEGLTYIGGANAWDEINLDSRWYPSGHTDLEKIAQDLKDETGLSYNPKTIPGSFRGNAKENGSGGAIDAQFMPIHFRDFKKWYDEANKRLDVDGKYPPASLGDPLTSTIMMVLYVASQWNSARPHYLKSNEAQQIAALMKWNPKEDEAKEVLHAGRSYYNTFQKPKK